MYASGIPVCNAADELVPKSSAQRHSPVEAIPYSVLPTRKTQDEDGIKGVVVVTPSVKKPLLTMDMFMPYEEKDLSSWKEDYNVCDAEFDDPSTLCTDIRGRAKKVPLVYKAIDDHNKLVAESKLAATDILYDARSERVARRSTAKKMGFTRPLRLTPSVIS